MSLQISFPKNIVDQAVPIKILEHLKHDDDINNHENIISKIEDIKKVFTVNTIFFYNRGDSIWRFRYTSILFYEKNEEHSLRNIGEYSFDIKKTKYATFKNIIKFLKKKGYISFGNGSFIHRDELIKLLDFKVASDCKYLVYIDCHNRLRVSLPDIHDYSISLYNKQVLDIIREYLEIFYPMIKRQQKLATHIYHEYCKNEKFLNSLSNNEISKCELYSELHKK